jgi:uncharacterized protein (DUF1330 family)
MKCYVYGEVTLKTREWVGAYLARINPFISKHGGIVLSRSIGMHKIEGERPLPTNVILVEFASREQALAFFADPEYQPLRRLRTDGSVSEFTLFPAEDLALAPMTAR